MTDEQVVAATYDALSAALQGFAAQHWTMAPDILLQTLVETTGTVARTMVRERPERRAAVLTLLARLQLFVEADGPAH